MQKLTTLISEASTELEPVNTFVKIDQVEGKEVVRVTKDPQVQAVDEPTFAKLVGFNFKNGVIEVAVLSKLLAEAPDFACGFIGVAFRINEDNSKFEGIYIRPTNGRAAEQLRRNLSTQYFSIPISNSTV